MEPVKKRRNSILKKKSADEDITTEIKARRISFSGKKSVKEFIAGEEAETIWGTSYEESADDLKVSSSESGLVNVHVKRIQLRNRRVICDPQQQQQQQQQKRRSSIRKKVLIAENDKENLCIKPPNPPTDTAIAAAVVEIVETVVQQSSALPLVRIEQTQSKSPSPIKSEFAVEKQNEQNVTVVSKNRETMPPKKLVVDCSSICSSTFDFINFSAQINKTITIEQSLDVSLNESELQLFKFRVPVSTTATTTTTTSTEISPNTSNVLCRSILMSEDDVNVMKMVRKQKKKGEMNAIENQIIDEELKLIETKKRDGDSTLTTDNSKVNNDETMKTHMDEQPTEIDTGNTSTAMEISQICDNKGSKRKSDRTAQAFPIDSTLVDMNSPMRKKPMHLSHYTSMDDTNNLIGNSSHQNKSIGMPTIYDSVALEESNVGINSLAGTNFLSHTIFDSKTIINESSSFPNTTAACLALGNQTDGISMELSLCTPNAQENQQPSSKTIFLPDKQMEYTLPGDEPAIDQIQRVKNSQTIYEASMCAEVTVPPTSNQKESIYTSIYMDEESPASSRVYDTKGLKLRQTIVSSEDIFEDSHTKNDPKCVFQKTTMTPIEIYEDSIQDEPDIKNRNCKTIYDPIEITEDHVSYQQPSSSDLNKNKMSKRESIYTPSDMIEVSPKSNESKSSTSKVGLKKRQTILNTEDMIEDTQKTLFGTASNGSANNRQTIFKPKDIELDTVTIQGSSIAYSKNNNPRQSIYTASDIIVDSPKSMLPLEAQSKRQVAPEGLKTRQTIFTPIDIIEDIPKECTSKSVLQKTNVKSIDMLEDSVQEDSLSRKSHKPTESVHCPSDMLEESIMNVLTENQSKSLKNRQTTFTPEDIIEDSIREVETTDVFQKTAKMPVSIFESSVNSLELVSKTTLRKSQNICQNTEREGKKYRESIHTPSDMIEDSPKPTRSTRIDAESSDPKKCQTLFTPHDIVVDSPKEATSKSLLQKTNKSTIDIFSELSQAPQIESQLKTAKNRQTIHESADIEEATTSNMLFKSCKTVYDPFDIEEVAISSEVVKSSSKDINNCRTILASEDLIEDSRSLAQKTLNMPFNIIEDTLQQKEPTLKLAVKDRRTVFDNADIEEEENKALIKNESSLTLKHKSINISSKIIPDNFDEAMSVQVHPSTIVNSKEKRQTTYNQVDLSLDSKTPTSPNLESKEIEEDLPKVNKQRAPSKIKVFRRELSSTDLSTNKSGKIQNVANLDSNQVKTSAPMFSYAAHQAKLQRKRQSIHTPVDMVEDSPKSSVKPPQSPKAEKVITVNESCNIKTVSPKQNSDENIFQKTTIVTDDDKPSTKNNRETIHTPLEMMQDSPKKPIELAEVRQTRLYETKPKTLEFKEQGSDLPFRKPTKLFTENLKSMKNPYSSTKTLMDQVMQDMGYSMNFQLQFPPEGKVASEKLPEIPSPTNDLYQSMNMTVEQNAMELSIADGKNSKKHQQNTMYLREGVAEEDVKKKSRQQMFNSQMELIGDDNAINHKTSQPHFGREAKSNQGQMIDESMGVSLLKSYSSYEQNKQPEVLKESRSQRQTIYFNQDLDEEDVNAVQKSLQSATISEKGQQSSLSHKFVHQTMYIHEDLEVEKIDDRQEPKAHEVPSRKTIHCNEDLDVETLQQSSVKSVNRKSAIETNKENTPPKEIRRKTMHLNEDLETSVKDSRHGINRRTMNLNENIEEEEDEQLLTSTASKLELPAKKKDTRRTIIMNQDLDLSEIVDLQNVLPEISSQDCPKANRRTNHTNQDLELEKTHINSPQANNNQKRSKDRQTVHLNHSLDLCEMDISQIDPHANILNQDPQVIQPKPSRLTTHINQDLDLSNVGKIKSEILPQDFININRRTNHTNQNLDIETSQINSDEVNHQKRPKARQTIHLNQDLDLCEFSQDHNQNPMVIPSKPNRQTIHFNQNLDLSEIHDLPKVRSPQKSFNRDSIPTNRKTNYLNKDLEIDEEDEQNYSQANRKTTFSPQDLDRHKSSKQRRQTILETQDLDMSIDSDVIHPKSKQDRQTVYFQQEIQLEDIDQGSKRNNYSSMPHQEIAANDYDDDVDIVKRKNIFNETKKNTEENAFRYPLTDGSKIDETSVTYFNNHKSGFKNTRNRQTVHFTKDNDLDESVKPVVVHASIDSATDDENSVNRNCLKDKKEVSSKYLNKQPRRVTICDAQTLDMDESILPKSTARKSSFMRTLNFDEVPNEMSLQKSTSTSLAKSKVTNDDVSPVYNPRLKPKIPMTPSEVDRSLAEYLKMEAAIEDEEEEIFFDAEDGTDNGKPLTNKRQTCHLPINILEESGMQPLPPSQPTTKRQTTFSPQKMTNESPNHYHALKSMKTHHNETLQQDADSSPKGIFQKSLLKSADMPMMDVSHSPKQKLMESRLETNSNAVQKNRQTLHFNESIDIADVSSTWKRSSAVQSVKEMLLENTRLFSQSNLMKPPTTSDPFENKQRSTVFFLDNQDSMDVSCIESGPADPECTPTKNKLSRIPQLIGSAKKLESLKKSMEFIQQELPNIGSHLRKNEAYENIDDSPEDQETPRRFSTSIPKKLEEMADESVEMCENENLSETSETSESPQKEVRQLQESFDTIDIPRKVLSSVRKTMQESPRRDGDEVPRRTINLSQKEALQESFDTVEIPRRGTTFQRNDTVYICPNEKETTVNASHKSLFQFDVEEPPITISDVSTFFSQKLLPNGKLAAATYSPNTTEALRKLNVNEIEALSRSPSSDDTTHNLANFKKRYVELTCDSLLLSDSRDNIEKTHLSLVNTFDDESEMVQPHRDTDIEIDIVPEISQPEIKPKSSSSTVCKKCKCQQSSTTIQNDTTIGSFMLEPLPVYEIDLSELEQLAKKPNIAAVGKVWRQKLRESDSFNVSDGSRSMAMDDEDSKSVEQLLMELAEERLTNTQYRKKNRKEVKIENSFLYKVRRKMQSISNWIINDILLFNNIIVLTHTRLRTFAILINFTPKDSRGVEVIFDDIQLKPNMLHTHQWKPYEYALHYQLLVELPFDLKKICPTGDKFFDLLEHVDEVVEDVLKTGREMLSLLLPSPASLIREPSGRLYIRKYVRTKTPQNDVKLTEFHIEIRNIKKLSYESIAMPPLYEFDENIQLLPVGNDFLRNFLNDPLKFIKK
ncbi:uncharacterized protein LOC129940999 [Eupeodes corollae]|uniref:uncharacterized protein LOC129940999 n=1 Tax=Eupeodes corollae TaxID=290404 RepID=UPI002493727E|nr:uncharacterized protein LOC129940999 [Eupeodes corollae]